jgi:hypothetical protein
MASAGVRALLGYAGKLKARARETLLGASAFRRKLNQGVWLCGLNKKR